MAQITVADGTTQTVASGETESGGPLVLDGTLELDGTLALQETTATATAGLGVTTTPVLSGAKNIVVSSAAGVSATAPVSGEKAITVSDPETTVATDDVLSVVAGTTDSYDSVTLDGTIELDGTLEVGGPGVNLGLSATATPDGEKDVAAAAGLGVEATSPVEGWGAINVRAETGLIGTADVSGEKDFATAAALGVSLTSLVENVVPLSRRSSLSVSDDRTDDFTVQGTGETE